MPYGLLGRPLPALMPHQTAWHPEAIDWQTRVVANGGSVPAATLLAVSNFCLDIDRAGLRPLLWRVNPMAGGNLASVLVPLYRSPTPFAVVGFATDTNDNFVAGDYTATSGLLGNGSNKRLITGLPLNFSFFRHAGMYLPAISTATFRTYVGGFGSARFQGEYSLDNGSPATDLGLLEYSDSSGAGGASGGTHANGDFVIGASNPISGRSFMQSNGVLTGARGDVRGAGALTTPLTIYAKRSGAGVNSSHANARIGGYTLGDGLREEQATEYYACWDRILRGLGRK